MILASLLIVIAGLSAALVVALQHNKNLVKLKEQLILKNDSLHMQQIETQKELMHMQSDAEQLQQSTVKKGNGAQ
ncbi:MAG: hypothetical protein JST86_14305 [Bacteroidetes bacterium]|nr:hypothetical protein [Bacteroidota bacterium]